MKKTVPTMVHPSSFILHPFFLSQYLFGILGSGRETRKRFGMLAGVFMSEACWTAPKG